MSYHTRVRGEFTISPPLAWAELKDSPFYVPDGEHSQRDLKLRVEAEEVDSEDGVLIRRTASALVMAWEDEYRAYDLLEHVEEAVTSFPGRTWSGRLECEGEENTDMWRVVIRDGHAVRIEPRIIWPDEQDGTAPAELEKLQARLEAAEAVCATLGLTAARLETDLDKALHELWDAWTEVARDHKPRHLTSREITRLARQRDAKRAATLAKSRELSGGAA